MHSIQVMLKFYISYIKSFYSMAPNASVIHVTIIPSIHPFTCLVYFTLYTTE